MNRSFFVQTFKITIPVLFGYIAIGIPFGLLVVNAGYNWWIAPLMSILMYAGAGQYMAISLFASGATLSTILIATLLINIRHIVYGLSLIRPFKYVGKWKIYLIFALTDETYALMTGSECPKGVNPGKFYGLIAVLNQLYWVVGSFIGAIIGNAIPFPLKGVDFALTALFAVLLLEQLKKQSNRIPAVIGIVCGIIALLIFGQKNMIITAIAFGIACLTVLRGKELKNNIKKENV